MVWSRRREILRPHQRGVGHDDDGDIEPVRGRARIPRLDHGGDEPLGQRVEHAPAIALERNDGSNNVIRLQ